MGFQLLLGMLSPLPRGIAPFVAVLLFSFLKKIKNDFFFSFPELIYCSELCFLLCIDPIFPSEICKPLII